ncbi:MAG: DUF6305 family protein [Bacillota bacterium]
MKLNMLSLALILLTVVLVISMNISGSNNEEVDILLLPSLPRPIASENVIITSAGQCTDAYIIRDIANQLMIHNYFMPQAEAEDLESINTIVIVIGYSPLGSKLQASDYRDEKSRIDNLIKRAVQDEISIIAVYAGGKERRGDKTDELIKSVCPRADYIISTRESDHDNLLTVLAKENNIPVTLVKGVSEISVPFASAFR